MESEFGILEIWWRIFFFASFLPVLKQFFPKILLMDIDL